MQYFEALIRDLVEKLINKDMEIKNLKKQLEKSLAPIKNSPAPKLYDGLTEEQWQRIIELGTLCEFEYVTEEEKYFPGILRGFYPNKPSPFSTTDSYLGAYRHCRISTLAGHIRPHFGGECPVNKNAEVIIKFNKGGWIHYLEAGDARWRWDRAHNIAVAFIELP